MCGFYGFHAAPSAPPISVTVSHVTTSTITVQWGSVNCSHHNGHLTGYSVRYRVQGHQNTQTMNVSGVSTAVTTISNLMVYTTYEIEVAAVNSAGSGMFSPVVIATTQPGKSLISLQSTCIQYLFHNITLFYRCIPEFQQYHHS